MTLPWQVISSALNPPLVTFGNKVGAQTILKFLAVIKFMELLEEIRFKCKINERNVQYEVSGKVKINSWSFFTRTSSSGILPWARNTGVASFVRSASEPGSKTEYCGPADCVEGWLNGVAAAAEAEADVLFAFTDTGLVIGFMALLKLELDTVLRLDVTMDGCCLNSTGNNALFLFSCECLITYWYKSFSLSMEEAMTFIDCWLAPLIGLIDKAVCSTKSSVLDEYFCNCTDMAMSTSMMMSFNCLTRFGLNVSRKTFLRPVEAVTFCLLTNLSKFKVNESLFKLILVLRRSCVVLEIFLRCSSWSCSKTAFFLMYLANSSQVRILLFKRFKRVSTAESEVNNLQNLPSSNKAGEETGMILDFSSLEISALPVSTTVLLAAKPAVAVAVAGCC
ncbi:hypothetical protein WICPIJ_006964 [Wickerhamomyces pijperi]|uniref:Uncharacterized protein n=1 Tax=Wickerhamomyces pijperi TaxID=599730 RepID=A0A9P8Q0R5_WICPI|nr:hypothetical protein WICPIJ_006964 [Wickerhamomyces pijperi]